MRRFATVSLFALTLAACAEPASETTATVFTNATFVTMDGPNTDALLVEDGRITALGQDDIDAALGNSVTIVDLRGATVLPGFVDSHVHVRELGMDAIKVDLVGAQSLTEIIARIRAQRPNPAPGEWIIGQGWDEGRYADSASLEGLETPGGYPDTAPLSAAFPDNPVALESLHGFAAMGNARAFEIAGIDADTPDPQGGTILRRSNGEPSGVLLTLAQALLMDAAPEITQEQRETAIRAGLARMAQAGVTSVHEAGMTGEDVAAFRALAERGELPIRVFGLLNGNDTELMDDWFEAGPLDDADDYLDIGGIKVFFDGSLGSRTAMLSAPYADLPDTARPTARISLNAIDRLAVQARDTGFQMAVHAIGDEANDCILASYELRLSESPYDHRWRIEHAQVVRPDFAERAAALNVIASMQPSHAVGDSAWAEARLGDERIRRAYAWKSLDAAGVPIIFNSDLPGEPWEPMQTLHFALTRTDLDGAPDGGWYADEVLTREQSLRAMTLAGAHAAFQDDTLGSLSVGKWADFVVLSGNPMTQDDVREIDVLRTYVAGEHVGGE